MKFIGQLPRPEVIVSASLQSVAPWPALVLLLKHFSCSQNGPRCGLELIASVQGNTSSPCVHGMHTPKRRFSCGLQSCGLRCGSCLAFIEWLSSTKFLRWRTSKPVEKKIEKHLKMVLSVMFFSSRISACNPELNLVFRDWDLAPLIWRQEYCRTPPPSSLTMVLHTPRRILGRHLALQCCQTSPLVLRGQTRGVTKRGVVGL